MQCGYWFPFILANSFSWLLLLVHCITNEVDMKVVLKSKYDLRVVIYISHLDYGICLLIIYQLIPVQLMCIFFANIAFFSTGIGLKLVHILVEWPVSDVFNTT